MGMAGGLRDSSGLNAEDIAENALLDAARFRKTMLREAGKARNPPGREDEREITLQPQPGRNAGETNKRRRHHANEEEDEE